MSRVPTAEITVDGQSLTMPAAGVVGIRVTIGAGPAIDAATLVVGWQSPIATSTPGAVVELALGYDAEDELVLTGDVQRVSGHPWGVRLDVHAEPGRLHRLRVGQSYLDSSPADIVAALAEHADVRTADLESTGALSVYHVDERRSAWRHANDLARLIGAELTCETDGALSMKAVGAAGPLGGLASAATQLLGGSGYRYGAELLDLRVGAALVAPAPAVVPHGAASPAGADKWHLLLREPDGGTPGGPTLVPGVARDRSVADALQAGLDGASNRRAKVGRVVVRGAPAVRVGGPVSVDDWPHGDVPDFRVTAVEHHIGPRAGFTTALDLEQAA